MDFTYNTFKMSRCIETFDGKQQYGIVCQRPSDGSLQTGKVLCDGYTICMTFKNRSPMTARCMSEYDLDYGHPDDNDP